MNEAKVVQVTLDETSVKILTDVDKIHRDSIINVGLALVSKTGYYKTLQGKNESDELEDIASLDDVNEDSPKNIKKAKKNEKPRAATSTWDNF